MFCLQVSLPNQIEKEGAGPLPLVTSPPMHPAVRRIAGGPKGKISRVDVALDGLILPVSLL